MLAEVARRIDEGAAGAIVLGVDSFGEPPQLEALDALGLSRCGARSDGFVPGEAAAALVLRRDGPGPVLAVASEAGQAAAGLTAALQRTWDEALREPRAEAVVDLDGARSRHDSWNVAALRALGPRGVRFDPVLPALSTGCVGAATGILHVALATDHARRGAAVLCASSDGGLAGAALVAPGGASP